MFQQNNFLLLNYQYLLKICISKIRTHNFYDIKLLVKNIISVYYHSLKLSQET